MLWVKGSGTDLATIDVAGFPGLRLDELLPLRARDAMDDASMVEYLLRTAIRPDQPRPSIETLLHAFIPADHVDHTHPDAVIALTSTPDGRRLAEEAFGDEAVWLDYERPGFAMSRRVAALLEGTPSARAVLLERHGLVTWGETSEECYRATIEFVDPSGGRDRKPPDRAGSAWAAGSSQSCATSRPTRCSPSPCPRFAARFSRTRTESSSRSTAVRRPSRSHPRRARPRSARSEPRALIT